MSAKTTGMQHKLAQLVALRERELEQHQAEMASQRQLVERYVGTVRRLEQLNSQLGPSGQGSASLASNSADYKQAVLQWAQQQREHLALHEADLAQRQQAMLALVRKNEALGQLQQRLLSRSRDAELRREQKQQDEWAGQVWQRRSMP